MMGIAWGHMTRERHKELSAEGIHLHVFLNGRDIMVMGAPVIEADDGIGQVLLYRTNEHGYITHPAETHVLRGTVEFKEVLHTGPCSAKQRAALSPEPSAVQ